MLPFWPLTRSSKYTILQNLSAAEQSFELKSLTSLDTAASKENANPP